jgi:hypothetical protein
VLQQNDAITTPPSSLLVFALLGALELACGSSDGSSADAGPDSATGDGAPVDSGPAIGGAVGDAGADRAGDVAASGDGITVADAHLAPPPNADPACEVGLVASSTLVMPGCGAGPAVSIPDSTYVLVAINRDFRCLPDLYPPAASGTIRVTGTAIAGRSASETGVPRALPQMLVDQALRTAKKRTPARPSGLSR